MHSNSQIHPTAVIHEQVIIEDNVYIGPNCIIGYPAEDKGTFPKTPFTVHICSGAKITGNVTIDAGTIRNTYIGRDCFLMKGSHVGHDVIIGQNVTLFCHAIVGGHVEIMDGANLGLGCIIHQRQKIWHYCMIGMGAIVTKKLETEPFCIYVGNPARKIGINQRGLEKNEISQNTLESIKQQFNENR
jgi:UDP-N-acetylglucosamine acyltransferase